MFVIKSRHRDRVVKKRRIDGKLNWHDRGSKSIRVIPLQI